MSGLETSLAEHALALQLEAVFGRLMSASGHELMNQQNGVQVNAQLITALLERSEPVADELVAASGRLLAESKRTVAMFNRLRSIGRLLANSGSEIEKPQLQAHKVLPELWDYLGATENRALALCCRGELELEAQGFVALAGFLHSLSGSAMGEICVELAPDGAQLSWECVEPAVAQQLAKNFLQPGAGDCLREALPAWLRARGHSGTLLADAVRCVLEIRLSGSKIKRE